MTRQEKFSSRNSSLLMGLVLLIVVLALGAASLGLFWEEGGEPFLWTTLQGQTVEIYGRGLYSYDTLFAGAGNRGTDAVTLFLGIPLLVVSTWLARRGLWRGALLQLGTIAYFLYVYAGFALGTVTYNPLFLVYIILFSASLYAFVLAFTAIDPDQLATHFTVQLPRRGPALFMLMSGIVTLVIWVTPLIVALSQNQPPARLEGRVTDALDLGIITPATWIAGILIWRAIPLGYLVALSMLILEILLLPTIAAQTVSQLLAGVPFTLGEILGPMVGFATLGLLALWVTISILKNIAEPQSLPQSGM